ncbi:hypothetical protein ACLOJK_024083 [Asimina triloba]
MSNVIAARDADCWISMDTSGFQIVGAAVVRECRRPDWGGFSVVLVLNIPTKWVPNVRTLPAGSTGFDAAGIDGSPVEFGAAVIRFGREIMSTTPVVATHSTMLSDSKHAMAGFLSLSLKKIMEDQCH